MNVEFAVNEVYPEQHTLKILGRYNRQEEVLTITQ